MGNFSYLLIITFQIIVNMASAYYTSPLYVNTLPQELTTELEKLQVLPFPEFEKHTMLVVSGQTLRDLFSAHLNARNQACGALMGMLSRPESQRNQSKWFQFLGILQREHQYLQTIAEYYNKVHAKQEQ